MFSVLILALTVTQAAAARPPADVFAKATVARAERVSGVLETDKGKITLELLPDKAPETVRQFLRLAAAEVYDLTRVHRILPNALIQTGAPYFRNLPLTARQQRLIHDLKPEFSSTPIVAGIVVMAHGDDPGSGQTSFFICTGNCKEFTGKYTAFARVVTGMMVVKAIAAVPLIGEHPKDKLFVNRVTIAKK